MASLESLGAEFADALAARDAREQTAFAALLQWHRSAHARQTALVEQIAERGRAVAQLEAQVVERDRQIAASRALGGDFGSASAKLLEVEAKASRVQEELNDSFRLRFQLEEKIKALTTRVAELEAQVAEGKHECTQKDETIAAARKLQASLQAKLTATEESVKLLQSELTAQRDAVIEAERRLREREKAYQQLEDQFVAREQSVAKQLEGEREMYEMQIRALKATSTVERARREVTGDAHATDVFSKYIGSDSASTIPTRVNRSLNPHDGEINDVAFTQDGTRFATASSDSTVKVFDARSCKMDFVLRGSPQSVMEVQFAPDANSLLGACADNAARIWDLRTHRVRHTLTGHTSKVLSACFVAGAKRALTGSHDRTLKLWDCGNGMIVKTLHCISQCNAVAVSIDSATIASGHVDGKLRVWTIERSDQPDAVESFHTNQVTAVRFSPDGELIVTHSLDHTLQVIDARSLKVARTLSADTHFNLVSWNKHAFSPDSKYVVAGSKDGMLHVWDVGTGKLAAKLEHHTGEVVSVAWSPLGSQILSCDRKRCVAMWE